MDEYIEVKIDVFEHTGQRARLRKSLTVAALVEEILKEFDDVAADAPGKYGLYLKGTDRALADNATLTQLDIQPQDELIFNYTRRTNRQMLDPHDYGYLKDDARGRVYEISWQPALIGRPTNDAEHNIMLAVNLQKHPLGHTISRAHARITVIQGIFFIESLAANNPVTVSGRLLPVNTRQELKQGDHILLGRNNLAMTFSTLRPSGTQDSGQMQVAQPPVQAAAHSAAKKSADEQTYTPPGGFAPVPSAVPPTPAVASRARFVIERALIPTKLGQSLEVSGTPFLLGRELPLLAGEGEISRRHAEIKFDPRVNQYTLTDLQSTNGVTLNGTRIEPNKPYSLRSGTKIGLGANFLMRFEV